MEDNSEDTMSRQRVSPSLQFLITALIAFSLTYTTIRASGPVGATPGVDTITVAHPRAFQRVTDARTYIAGLVPAKTFVVTSTLDLPDTSLTDGIFFPPTFRAAIENANLNPDFDRIEFDFGGGGTVGISSQLPTVSQPCIIDGAGTGTSPVIIDGTAAGVSPGVWINANGCVVQNLEIQNFNGAGLVVGSTVGHRDMIVQNVRTHHNNGAGINVNELRNGLIGGTAPDETNRIYSNSGTGGHGISFTGLFLNNDSNVVIGNWIGTTNGFDSAGNSRRGLYLESGRNNIISNNIIVASEYGNVLIGDASLTPDIGNVVEYNLIGVAGDGTTALVDQTGTATGIVHGYSQSDTIRSNVISGHPYEGVYCQADTYDMVIDSNLIGSSWDTTTTVWNGFEAIRLTGRGHMLRGNIVNGSSRGISIRNPGDSMTVQGNWAGRHASYPGLTANSYGIFIQGTANLIGGPDPSDANVCSWNGSGIWMRGAACSLNVIQNNTIGLNQARTDSVPNGFNGIGIQGSASNNRIIDNVIGANWASGIYVVNLSTQEPHDNIIQGNYIGVSPVGLTSFPNEWGISLENTAHNVIGGLGANQFNRIMTNNQEGVWISGDSNQILNNIIIQNGLTGVNVVGGVANTIRLNTIDDNGLLGIDLNSDSVTANDGLGDLDVGPNELQNFPVIDSIRSGGADIVYGNLGAAASTTYMLDLYVSTTCDTTGYGEGEYWVDSAEVTTDALGFVAFSLDITGAFAGGQPFLTITATDPDGNTSEFCQCDTVSSSGGGGGADTVDVAVIKTSNADTVNLSDTVIYTITVKNGGPSAATPVGMNDTLPVGITYLEHAIGLGSCSFAGNVLSCNIPSLASGDSTVITLTARADAPGTTLNRALAGASQTEANPIDNKDSAEVFVRNSVAVDDRGDQIIPSTFALGANYPNPFNPVTAFTYDLPEAAVVRIEIYNVLGRTVRTLVDGRRAAGRYTVQWDGRGDKGNPVSSGVYLYRIKAGSFTATRRMVLLK